MVEGRIRDKLALWKRIYLSKDGRLTPIYFMPLFVILEFVALTLENIHIYIISCFGGEG